MAKSAPRRSGPLPKNERQIESQPVDNLGELQDAVLKYINADHVTSLNPLENFDVQVTLLNLEHLDTTKIIIPNITVTGGRGTPGLRTWCSANIKNLLPKFDASGLTPETIINAYIYSLRSLDAAEVKFTAGLKSGGPAEINIKRKIEHFKSVVKRYFSRYTEITDAFLEQETRRLQELKENAVERERLRNIVVETIKRLLPGKKFDFVVHQSGIAISVDKSVNDLFWNNKNTELNEEIRAYAQTLPEGATARITYNAPTTKKPEQISETDKLNIPLTRKLEQILTISRVFQVTGDITRDQLAADRATTEAALSRHLEARTIAEDKVRILDNNIQSLTREINELKQTNDTQETAVSDRNRQIAELETKLNQERINLQTATAENNEASAKIVELTEQIQRLVTEIDAAQLRERQLKVYLSEVGFGDFDAGMRELVLALRSFDPETTPSPEERKKLEEAVDKIFDAIAKKNDAQIPNAPTLPVLETTVTSGPVMIADVFTNLFATVVIYNGFRHYGQMSESLMMAIISYIIASTIHQGTAGPILERAAGKKTTLFNPRFTLMALLAGGVIVGGSEGIIVDNKVVVEAEEIETGVSGLETQLSQEITSISEEIERLRTAATDAKDEALSREKVRGVTQAELDLNPDAGIGPAYKALEAYFDPKVPQPANDKPNIKLNRPTTRRAQAEAMRVQVGIPEGKSFDEWLVDQQTDITKLTEKAKNQMAELKTVAAKSNGISLSQLKGLQILRTFVGDKRAAAKTGVEPIDDTEADKAFSDLIKTLQEIESKIARLKYNIHRVQNGFEALKEQFSTNIDQQLKESAQPPEALTATTNATQLKNLEVTIEEAVEDVFFKDSGTINSLLLLALYAFGTEGLGLLVASGATSIRRAYFSSKRPKLSAFETKLALAQDTVVDKLTPAIKAMFDLLIGQTGDSSISLNTAFVREWLTTRMGQAALENHGQVPVHYAVTQKPDGVRQIVAIASDAIGQIGSAMWAVGTESAARLMGTHAHHSEPEERMRNEAEFMKRINACIRENADLIDTANALHAIHPTLGELFVGIINQYDPGNSDLPNTQPKLRQRVDISDMLADMSRYVSMRAELLQAKLATTNASLQTAPFPLEATENTDPNARRFTDAQVDAMRIHYRLSEMLTQTLALMESLATTGYLPPATPDGHDENLRSDLARSLDKTVGEVEDELSEEEKASIHKLVNELGKKMGNLCSNAENNLPKGTSLQATVAPGTQGLNLRVNLVRDNHIIATAICHEPLPAHTQKIENRDKYLLGVETWFQTNGLARLIGTEKHTQLQTRLAQQRERFGTDIELIDNQELTRQITTLLSEQTLAQRQEQALTDPKMTLADFTNAETQGIANEEQVYQQAIAKLVSLSVTLDKKIAFSLNLATQTVSAHPKNIKNSIKTNLRINKDTVATIQLTDCLTSAEFKNFEDTVKDAI
jgi:outer membrane murein-binding lipoprotein Lpp